MLYQVVSQQPYQSRQSPHIYQYTEKKKIYPIDSDLAFEIDEEDGNAEGSYFTNKGYEELQVKFVGIKSIYDRCSTSFQSYSALH